MNDPSVSEPSSNPGLPGRRRFALRSIVKRSMVQGIQRMWCFQLVIVSLPGNKPGARCVNSRKRAYRRLGGRPVPRVGRRLLKNSQCNASRSQFVGLRKDTKAFQESRSKERGPIGNLDRNSMENETNTACSAQSPLGDFPRLIDDSTAVHAGMEGELKKQNEMQEQRKNRNGKRDRKPADRLSYERARSLRCSCNDRVGTDAASTSLNSQDEEQQLQEL